jgi:hypothetical protein
MEPNKPEIKQYADGWITERAGTDVPKFLKFAFIVIAGACLAYLLIFMNGEVDHPDRGQLVRAFNAATEASAGLMYAVAAMVVAFGVIVVAFAFSKPHD